MISSTILGNKENLRMVKVNQRNSYEIQIWS